MFSISTVSTTLPPVPSTPPNTNKPPAAGLAPIQYRADGIGSPSLHESDCGE